MQGLAEKGFGGEQLAEMQKIIDAEKSDLFDVLAHVAYALAAAHPRRTRRQRPRSSSARISTASSRSSSTSCCRTTSASAWKKLDQDKLTPLLRLKYHDSIADAVADLGRPDEIGRVFAGFQRFLTRTGGGESVASRDGLRASTFPEVADGAALGAATTDDGPP